MYFLVRLAVSQPAVIGCNFSLIHQKKTKQIIQQKVLLSITSDRDWESHRAVHNWPNVSLPLKTEINVLVFTNIILAFTQITIAHFIIIFLTK
jgi:hypothetical protein